MIIGTQDTDKDFGHVVTLLHDGDDYDELTPISVHQMHDISDLEDDGLVEADDGLWTGKSTKVILWTCGWCDNKY